MATVDNANFRFTNLFAYIQKGEMFIIINVLNTTCRYEQGRCVGPICAPLLP